jgi:GTP-binding protein
VRDVPGVTRDRLYGTVAFERWQAAVVDTGGFEPQPTSDLVAGVRAQVLIAIEEADLILFVVDGRAGVTPLDEEIASVLRRSDRPVILAVNKVDGPAQEPSLGECYRLGFSPVLPISAEHGRGVAELLEAARDRAPVIDVEVPGPGVRVAIIGRPNVGKSSLVNAVLGHERVLVHAEPGTTRDTVDTPVTFRDRPYVLIDTAGIRRKGKVSEALEKLSVVMALKSLERTDVAVLVLDASEGVTAQDAHIAGYADEAGRALVLAVNKWDLVPRGLLQKADVVAQIYERLPFLEYAPVCFTVGRRAPGPAGAVRPGGSRRRRGEEAGRAELLAHGAAPGHRAAPHVGPRPRASNLLGPAGRGVAAHVRPAREPADRRPFLLPAVSPQYPAPRLRLRRLAHPHALPKGRGEAAGGPTVLLCEKGS